jgi:hypothetical protein
MAEPERHEQGGEEGQQLQDQQAHGDFQGVIRQAEPRRRGHHDLDQHEREQGGEQGEAGQDLHRREVDLLHHHHARGAVVGRRRGGGEQGPAGEAQRVAPDAPGGQAGGATAGEETGEPSHRSILLRVISG